MTHKRYGIIDGCTTQLVSPDTYRRFFMERDNRILSLYPHGGMIHLCGAAEQHIPAFRAMPALKAVQLNDRAAEAFEQYYEGLRDDQVIYFNTLPDRGAEEILHYTGGRRVVIV